EGGARGGTGACKSLAGAKSLNRFFSGWQPSTPRYAALRSALANYLALADRGGWGFVPLGEALKPGIKDHRVPAIRTRLRLTDGVRPSSAESEIYDDALTDAVKRFQASQGLESEGVI